MSPTTYESPFVTLCRAADLVSERLSDLVGEWRPGRPLGRSQLVQALKDGALEAEGQLSVVGAQRPARDWPGTEADVLSRAAPTAITRDWWQGAGLDVTIHWEASALTRDDDRSRSSIHRFIQIRYRDLNKLWPEPAPAKTAAIQVAILKHLDTWMTATPPPTKAEAMAECKRAFPGFFKAAFERAWKKVPSSRKRGRGKRKPSTPPIETLGRNLRPKRSAK